MKAIAITITSVRTANHRMIFTLAILGACAITALFYAANLYSLISHSVAIQKTEARTAAISSELSSLDSEYLKLASNITPDELSKHGLAEGHVSAYISRPAQTASLGGLVTLSHEL